ncbi:PREDICTED: uncharacterized protein LOC107603621 [Ficedula albicollis]|uniref:uncharacterized protein LOC107603621 n=1 Tax=Ficedula albicollis TaxID=59894 RepID=UPI0007AD8373|nr:PREDICTED: uncharacterized protein LOC107603621 [Ficedula albicollis]
MRHGPGSRSSCGSTQEPAGSVSQEGKPCSGAAGHCRAPLWPQLPLLGWGSSAHGGAQGVELLGWAEKGGGHGAGSGGVSEEWLGSLGLSGWRRREGRPLCHLRLLQGGGGAAPSLHPWDQGRAEGKAGAEPGRARKRIFPREWPWPLPEPRGLSATLPNTGWGFGVCAGPGAGLGDPGGPLPAQPVVWLCSPGSGSGRTCPGPWAGLLGLNELTWSQPRTHLGTPVVALPRSRGHRGAQSRLWVWGQGGGSAPGRLRGAPWDPSPWLHPAPEPSWAQSRGAGAQGGAAGGCSCCAPWVVADPAGGCCAPQEGSQG